MTSTHFKPFAAVITVAFALALPGCGETPTVDAAPAAQKISTSPSRATRIREYKQMIVGLYRVPPAIGDDPIEALKRALTTQYGAPAGSGLET